MTSAREFIEDVMWLEPSINEATHQLKARDRESWSAGVRALAAAITDRGVYHPALENAVENLIDQGPK